MYWYTLWMSLLPTHNFTARCFGSFNNNGWVIYAELPNVDIQYNKSHSLISPPVSSEKSYILGIFHVHSCRCKSSKILIFTWKWEFHHGQKILSFPWSNRLIYFIFKKISAKYPSLFNHSLFVCLPVVLSCKSGVPWGKVASSAHHSNNYTGAFPQGNHHTSIYHRNALCTF